MKQYHTLISEGPYRWVRHLMYTTLFSFFVGLALTSSWLIVILVAAAILVLYARIGKEETIFEILPNRPR